jgi:hypothetical protein
LDPLGGVAGLELDRDVERQVDAAEGVELHPSLLRR